MTDKFSAKVLVSGLNPTKGRFWGKFIFFGFMLIMWCGIAFGVYKQITKTTIGTQQTIANAESVVVEAENKRPAFSLIQWGRLSVLHLDLE